MTIARATLRSNVFRDVYDNVNNNVTDPESRNKQWIFAALPDLDPTKFVGYPFLIIENTIDKDHELFDNAHSDVTGTVTISIYSTKKSVLDTLGDSIDAVMIPSNLTQFNFISYDEEDTDIILQGNNIHVRTMVFTVGVVFS